MQLCSNLSRNSLRCLVLNNVFICEMSTTLALFLRKLNFVRPRMIWKVGSMQQLLCLALIKQQYIVYVIIMENLTGI